jgi:hypothetical protein
VKRIQASAHFEDVTGDDYERYVAALQGHEHLLAGPIAQAIIDYRRIDGVRGEVVERCFVRRLVGLRFSPHFSELEIVIDSDDGVVLDDQDSLAPEIGVLIILLRIGYLSFF